MCVKEKLRLICPLLCSHKTRLNSSSEHEAYLISLSQSLHDNSPMVCYKSDAMSISLYVVYITPLKVILIESEIAK